MSVKTCLPFIQMWPQLKVLSVPPSSKFCGNLFWYILYNPDKNKQAAPMTSESSLAELTINITPKVPHSNHWPSKYDCTSCTPSQTGLLASQAMISVNLLVPVWKKWGTTYSKSVSSQLPITSHHLLTFGQIVFVSQGAAALQPAEQTRCNQEQSADDSQRSAQQIAHDPLIPHHNPYACKLDFEAKVRVRAPFIFDPCVGVLFIC